MARTTHLLVALASLGVVALFATSGAAVAETDDISVVDGDASVDDVTPDDHCPIEADSVSPDCSGGGGGGTPCPPTAPDPACGGM